MRLCKRAGTRASGAAAPSPVYLLLDLDLLLTTRPRHVGRPAPRFAASSQGVAARTRTAMASAESRSPCGRGVLDGRLVLTVLDGPGGL